MPQFTTNLEGRSRSDHLEEYIATNKSDSMNRGQARVIGRGFQTEAFDASNGPNNTQPSHGNCLATLVYMRAGDLISNLSFYVVSAAGSNCYLKGCIWDTSGNLLFGTSGNLSTAFSTGVTSYVTSGLTAQYQPAADVLVYVGLAVSTAAGPKVLGGGAPALNQNNRVGSGFSYSVTASLATSDASSVTFNPNTLGAPWAALL